VDDSHELDTSQTLNDFVFASDEVIPTKQWRKNEKVSWIAVVPSVRTWMVTKNGTESLCVMWYTLITKSRRQSVWSEAGWHSCWFLVGLLYGISTLSRNVVKYLISAATVFVTQFSVLMGIKTKKKSSYECEDGMKLIQHDRMRLVSPKIRHFWH